MMRNSFLSAALLAALLAGAADAVPPSSADRTALERIAAENDAAWDEGHAATISLHYSEEGSLRLGTMPEAVEGRTAIGRYLESSFARRPAGLRHVTRLQRIDMVAPDLALADAHVRVEQNRGGEWVLVREFLNHSLVRREGGAWRLHAVRAHRLPGTGAGAAGSTAP